MKVYRLLALCICGILAVCCVGCKKQAQQPAASSVPEGVVYYDGNSSTVLTGDSVKKQIEAGSLSVTVSAGHSHDEEVDDTPAQGVVTLGMESSELCALLQQGGFDTQSLEVRQVTEEYIGYICPGIIRAYYTNDDRDNGLAALVYYDTAFGFETRKTTPQQIKQVLGEPDYEGPVTEEAAKEFLFNQTGGTYLDYDCGNHHASFFIDEYTGQLSATVLYQEGLWIY